jgi:hypothetical protein
MCIGVSHIGGVAERSNAAVYQISAATIASWQGYGWRQADHLHPHGTLRKLTGRGPAASVPLFCPCDSTENASVEGDQPQPPQGLAIHVRDVGRLSPKERDALVDKAVLRELATQAEFVLMAASDMGGALRDRDISRIWFSLQALLTSGANLSKLLWGGTVRCRQ